MPILVWWAGTAIIGVAATAFSWKAGEEVGEDLGLVVKVAAVAGAAYVVYKVAK